MTWTVLALYRFVALENLPALQTEIKGVCEKHDICGTLLIATEGVNGTIAGPSGEAIDAIEAKLEEIAGISKGEVKRSTAEERPFRRMKVRLKREIVTLRAPEADPTKQVGTYVEPKDWNDLITQEDITLIDTRNDYETVVGMFEGTIDPNIKTFTEFKGWVEENLSPEKHKKVAMFCTGGIRCEKASSYMLSKGFEEVYHLKGGILKYLEDVPQEDSKWNGACFVFDRRVAVGQDLEETPYDLCYGCRWPLTAEDRASEKFEKGVSCPHCYDDLSEEKAHAFRMRHQQFVKEAKLKEESAA